jgi:O-Antigen ligase
MVQTHVTPPEESAIGRQMTFVPGIRRVGSVVPAAAVIVGVVGLLASAQGGYFPTSWGWASTALFLALGIWALASGRSAIGRSEYLFVTLLAVYVGWTGLSIVWSDAPAYSVLELERGLVPVSCVAAFLVFARRSELAWLTFAFELAIAGIATYALSTRLFPDSLAAFDPFAIYRLSSPIGYWNGLGILCVIGLLAGLAVVSGLPSRSARAVSGASCVVLGTALYFTYSRASWVALAIGLVVVVLVSSQRLATVATTAVLSVPVGLAVLAASHSPALTHRESVLPDVVGEGRRLAVVVAVLALVAAGSTVLLGFAEHRMVARPGLTRAFGIAGWLAVPVVLVAMFVQFGTPIDLAQRTWISFESPPQERSRDLNDRLFSLSGNGRADLWTVAWQTAENHPVVGAGAGTFERFWQVRPESSFRVRDAHGLYVETLAELGTIGLVLLAVGLAIPLVAALAARKTPVVPALAGAYVAFLVHAGVDWDWELTAVTSTGLLAGCLLLLARRTRTSRTIATPVRAGVVTVALVASVAGLVGLVGNSAVAHGRSAIGDGDTLRAIQQANRARMLMPWSPDPWLVRGEAELASGDARNARKSFSKAIDIDPHDWRGWHDLAIASSGRERAHALRQALSLYPASSEIQRTIQALRSKAKG